LILVALRNIKGGVQRTGKADNLRRQLVVAGRSGMPATKCKVSMSRDEISLSAEANPPRKSGRLSGHTRESWT
jgi:hypothetical protein